MLFRTITTVRSFGFVQRIGFPRQQKLASVAHVRSVSVFSGSIVRMTSTTNNNAVWEEQVQRIMPTQMPQVPPVSKEYGANMDQEELMETDLLVAVDEMDRVIGRDNGGGDASDSRLVLSKRDGHTFGEKSPRGVLHRAFSLFLFNESGELLLTKRAGTKITFPGVWTNSVCSHPLHGMEPCEVDSDFHSAYPHFPGVKNAAVRKCRHELGLCLKRLMPNSIQFVTRYHYWAADTKTYGLSAPWGEHEVDYVLFAKIGDMQDFPINPCPDEVDDFRFVSIDELRSMLCDPTLQWSPWFVGILQRGGWEYWENLEATLAGNYTNDVVTFFDPPSEHFATYNLPSHTRQTGVMSIK